MLCYEFRYLNKSDNEIFTLFFGLGDPYDGQAFAPVLIQGVATCCRALALLRFFEREKE